MKMKRTLGSGQQMPSMNVSLPRYVVVRQRGKGQTVFYFQVPKRLRPEGWAGAYRLPMEHAARTGLGDALETAAVKRDGDMLYARLIAERTGTKLEPKYGTMIWLIRAYEHSEHFATLAPKTRRSYSYCARIVSAWAEDAAKEIGSEPVVEDISRPAVIRFLDTMNETPSKRNAVGRYLRILLGFAIDKGLMAVNPAIHMHLKTPESTIRLWKIEEVDTVVATADGMEAGSIGTAVLLAHEAGQRQGDILRLQEPRDYTRGDGMLRFWQHKTNSYVTIPATERLRERLALRPITQLVLVANEKTGKRYDEDQFRKRFRAVTDKADVGNLWFMHLRHTAVVNYARAGCSVPEIASITGHTIASVTNILKHYLPRDNELARTAVAKLEVNRRT